MTKSNSVDVIILSWDRMEDTIAAIQSALDQKNIDQHIIIVDQGSQSDNLALLKDFCVQHEQKITLICNTENVGVPAGRNQASFAGQGKYIVSLDNDAEFLDEMQLFQMVNIMEEDHTLGALAFRILSTEGVDDDASSWSYSEDMAEFSAQIFPATRFVGAGHCLRRDGFEKISGYDEKLFFMHEEVDLSKRLLNAGYRIEYNPSVVIRHKVSSEHRVSWSGKRFYLDVRNRTYLHLKHGTPFLTTLLHTGLLVMKGVKNGYGWSAFKGLFSALKFFPAAMKHRRSDLYVRQTESAKVYIDNLSPTKGMNAWQKIKFRFFESNKKLETNR